MRTVMKRAAQGEPSNNPFKPRISSGYFLALSLYIMHRDDEIFLPGEI